MTALKSIIDCLELSQEALQILRDQFETAEFADNLSKAVELLVNTQGRLVVSGMGKSGIIGKKLTATFASTGTPSLFLHPAEASHGDLGMVQKGDTLFLLSVSGESKELGDILRYAKRFLVPIIAMTANPESSMGRAADLVLKLPKVKEGCPHNLAPTSSTLIQLALGDAIAITLLKEKGFSEEDFFNFHPGGKLGAALAPVTELMDQGKDLPLQSEDAPIADVLTEIGKKGFGIVGLTNSSGALSGVITDGDIRRYMAENTDGSMKDAMFGTYAKTIMTAKFIAISPERSGAKALGVLEENKIGACFILDDGKPIGLIRLLTLIQKGVV